MLISNFIGNETQIAKLTKWLNDYFHSKTNKTPDYAVLYGTSGNGKTALVYCLASAFDVDVYKITSNSTINESIQSLNLQQLDGKSKKIILVDDYNEIKNKSQLLKIPSITNFPVIFTNNLYPPEELRSGLTLEIKKPRSSQLLALLQTKPHNLTPTQLLTIARDSISVRSALNSLHTGLVNKSVSPNINILDIKRNIVQRGLKQNLTPLLLRVLYKNMNCYTPAGLKCLDYIAAWDAEFKIKYKPTIDSFIINNSPAPLESLAYLTNKTPSKNQKPSKPKPIKPTHNDIDSFF